MLEDRLVIESLMELFFIYLGIINVISFSFMAADKYKAKKQLSRIPEKTLFLLALCGGSLGVQVAMSWLRHKTLHKSFKFGIPVIMAITYSITFYLILHPESIMKIVNQ